ncbi:MAG TPA: hypothetical protein DEF02_00625 [Clostridiales bacterium]|nr:hypothetical protein [Clostridiales bacterium]
MKQSNVNENTNEKQVKISQAKAEPQKTTDIKNKLPDLSEKDLKNKRKIIRELLHQSDKELTDEELVAEVLSTNVTENSEKNEKVSFGQKAADAVAKFAGSWAFIFSFVAVMVIWMVVNIILGTKAFDAYPFILLNLVLSCIAAIQAPLIMMSQNRQEAKDRKRAENDYRVNLKSEFLIDELYKKLEQVSETQKKLLKMLEDIEQNSKNDSASENK